MSNTKGSEETVTVELTREEAEAAASGFDIPAWVTGRKLRHEETVCESARIKLRAALGADHAE